jgi:hypothetical protein
MQGTGGKPLTPRLASVLSRSLLKSALELAWKDLGQEVLLEKFDHVREAVLGAPRDGYFMMAKQSDHPDSRVVTMTYYPLDDRMVVGTEIYGIGLFTDSRLATPPIAPSEAAAHVVGFTSTDFPSRRQGKRSASPVEIQSA